jgi:hypothetical protein
MFSRICLVAPIAASLVACAPETSQPPVAPSTSQAAWAAAYADHLQDSAKAMDADRTKARALDDGLAQRLTDVKTPTNNPALLSIVERADAAGRSEAYVTRRREDDAVRGFWDDERGPIAARAAASAKVAVGDAKCEKNPDPSPAVSYALRDGVDKALEKRDRQGNDAHVLVDRYKVSLGNGNYAAVQKLADDVALASYLAYIALPEEQNQLNALLADRQKAHDTLERAIAEEHAFENDKGRTDAEKKGAEDRIAQLQKSESGIDAAVVNANVSLKNLDEQIRAAQTAHDDAVRKLTDTLRQRTA